MSNQNSYNWNNTASENTNPNSKLNADENYDTPPKSALSSTVNKSMTNKTFTLWIPKEQEYRKQLYALSVYDWDRERTPKRRDLFKHAKVALKSTDTQWGSVPRLAVISGITHSTWNRTIQALFSTQNCDVMFSLSVGIIYFQRALAALPLHSSTTITIEGETVQLDSAVAKNMLFVASNIVSMKFYDDLHLSNKYMGRIFRVPIEHINKWEVLLLELLQFNLKIHEAEKAQMKFELSSHIDLSYRNC